MNRLRLLQACSSLYLLPDTLQGYILERMAGQTAPSDLGDDDSGATNTMQQLTNALQRLDIADRGDSSVVDWTPSVLQLCAVCGEPIASGDDSSMMTFSCCPVLCCQECGLHLLQSGADCPQCGQLVSTDDTAGCADGDNEGGEDKLDHINEVDKVGTDKRALLADNRQRWPPSTKIATLVARLQALRQDDPEARSVVFSQWTSMLDQVEWALNAHNIRYARLDGRMSRLQKNRVVQLFQQQEQASPCEVLLVSLKVT